MIDHDADGAGKLDDVPTEYYDDETGPAPVWLSEDALSVEFVGRNAHRLKWTAGMDWFHNTGQRWAPDDTLKRFNFARTVVREAAAKLDEKNIKLARKIASNGTVGSIISLSKSDPSISIPVDAWDSDPMALNTPGGIVDLKSGNIRPRAGDFVTRCARCTPDASIPTPVWNNFLDSVFDKDEELIEFIRRLLGYFITADRREQKIFFAHGLGSNGKSTLFNFFQWLCGDYALDLPAEVLMTQRNPGHPTELAQLRGIRIAISGEIERGSHWAEARINRLTGEETLTARVMRGDPFTFIQTQKHLVVGNHKPRLDGSDPALVRRFVLIPFDAVFAAGQRDMTMIDKLKAEAPGVLAWVIQGSVEWFRDGLQIPSKISNSSSEYMEENDDIGTWMSECCVMQSSSPLSKAGDLYDSYSTWIKGRGQFPVSLPLWAKRLKTNPSITSRKSGSIRYEGLSLTQAERDRIFDLPLLRRR